MTQKKFLGIFTKTNIFQKYNNFITQLLRRGNTQGGITDSVKAMECSTRKMDELASIGLLDEASLVITPTTYGEGRLFAAKPVPLPPVELITNGASQHQEVLLQG